MGVRKKAKIALEVFLVAVFFLFVLLSFKSVRKGIESDKSGNYRNPSEVFNTGKVRSLSQATKILDELNASDHPESTPSKIDGYMYNRYVIDAFDVHMVVKENNEMEITENKIFTGLVDGRIKKQLKEMCLLDQTYVRAEDGKQTVAEYLKSVDADLKLTRVIRFEVGEGIEKKEENFAEEVAAQLK